MEKITETKEQVIVLDVVWLGDVKHVGKVATLRHRETHLNWASGDLPDGTTVVMRSYIQATELNKALI